MITIREFLNSTADVTCTQRLDGVVVYKKKRPRHSGTSIRGAAALSGPFCGPGEIGCVGVKRRARVFVCVCLCV